MKEIKRKNKSGHTVVRELALFLYVLRAERSLRLTYIFKKAIDSVHVSFGKNRIMRFSLDK